jgi:hypothetical protein
MRSIKIIGGIVVLGAIFLTYMAMVLAKRVDYLEGWIQTDPMRAKRWAKNFGVPDNEIIEELNKEVEEEKLTDKPNAEVHNNI